jgi:predicted methyltransferase
MKIWIAASVLILSQAFLEAQNKTLTMEEMHRLHQDSKAYISFLEDPQRDAYQNPHEVILALSLREGEIVADIGAGSGYFTLRLAHHVGDNGRVYAVDINPDMIVHLNRRIRDVQLKNVVTVLAVPDDPRQPHHGHRGLQLQGRRPADFARGNDSRRL